jgi:hypothetical protein
MENFTHINDSDRVWIYQANRVLNNEEVGIIKASGNEFISSWAAHGKKLHAGVMVLHKLFVIVYMDEKQEKASGCSIDASVHWISALGEDLGINFLERTKVAYVNEEKTIELVTLEELEKRISLALFDENTEVFNNMVYSGKDLKHSWRSMLKNSWHSRYLPAIELK